MNDTRALRELCNKATPGKWWVDSHGHRMMSMDSFQTVFQTAASMGPAVRHRETANLSHWPNDWDATLALLDEIDALRAALKVLA